MLPVLLILFVVGDDSASGAKPVITTAAGTGRAGYSGDGGKATAAQLNQPFHCALDKAGNLYVAEAFNHCIRKIDAATGLITTVAGNGTKATAATAGRPSRP
jgi:hypothetical protein